MIGKSRIALIKENSLSITNLELQAAVTASTIKVRIMEELKETVNQCIPLLRLDNCDELFAQLFKFWMLLTMSIKFLIVPI